MADFLMADFVRSFVLLLLLFSIPVITFLFLMADFLMADFERAIALLQYAFFSSTVNSFLFLIFYD